MSLHVYAVSDKWTFSKFKIFNVHFGLPRNSNKNILGSYDFSIMLNIGCMVINRSNASYFIFLDIIEKPCNAGSLVYLHLKTRNFFIAIFNFWSWSALKFKSLWYRIFLWHLKCYWREHHLIFHIQPVNWYQKSHGHISHVFSSP